MNRCLTTLESSVLKQEFRREAGYWVHMCAHRLKSALNAELSEHKISYRQCQVLAWLSMEESLSQVELARNMGVEPPTIVPVLDRMERDGLIVRAACPTDRRKRIILPTEAAVPVWEQIVECSTRVNDRATAGLSKAETNSLRKALEHMYGNLSDGDVPATSA